MISKGGQYPTFNNKDSRFYLCFVLRLPGSCRNYNGSIVLSQILISWIDIGLISARMGHAGFEVVRHKDFRNAAKKLKGMNVRFNPEGQFLGRRCFCVGIVAGAKNSQKYLGLGDFSCCPVDYRHGLAGIVNEKFFPGSMLLPQTNI